MTTGRRAPRLLPDLLAAARAEAGRLGLQPPDADELAIVTFVALGREYGPFRPAEMDAVTDLVIARARARRPLYRVELLADGRPAIVADLDGAADIVAPAVAELRRLAAAAHRERVLADLADLPPERVARRWGITPRTLRRWRTFEVRSCPLRRRVSA